MPMSSRHLPALLTTLLLACNGLAAALPAAVHPASASTDNAIVQFDLGNNHSCAVVRSGALLCWGDNRNGQTGSTAAESEYNRVRTPAQVFASGATAVSASYANTCAIVDDGLYCWGWNYAGQVGNGKTGGNVDTPFAVITHNVRAVSTGSMHSCAVVGDALYCWGDNSNGQIGNGTTGTAVAQPTQVIASGVTAVSAGGDQTCAIVKGALYCWGNNRYGQVGHTHEGNASNQNTSLAIPARIFDKQVTAVSAGNDYTCAVVAKALYCWGKTDDKGIGPNARSNTYRPQQMIARDVTAVATGTAHTCAVVKDALQCWGYNGSNVIGTGPSPGVITRPAVAIPAGVTAVSAGESHTCALVNGTLRCRGYDAYGQIPPDTGYLPFTDNKGDVRTLDHTEADRIAALKKTPAVIASFIKDKLIEQDGVLYLVTQSQAFLRDGGYEEKHWLALSANVIPLYAIQIAENSAAPGTLTATIAPGATCGDVEGSNNQLSLENLRLQQDNRLINLKDALNGALPVLPAFSTPAPALMSTRHAETAQACARTVMARLEALPYRSISLHGSDSVGTLPITLDEITSETVSSVTGITVEPSGKATAALTMQAQVMAFMRCGDTTLYSWKEADSAPWNLPLEGNTFQIDEDILAGEAPDFPAYTQAELRRAINEAQQLLGLAPVEATQSCRPVLGGTQFILSHGDTPVKTLALFYPAPTDMKTPSCQAELPMLALLTARDLGYPMRRHNQFSSCKAWPDDTRNSIVALSYLQSSETDTGQDSRSQYNKYGNEDGMGDYDLDVLIVNSTTRKPLARLLQKAAIASDAWRFNGLAIDTARYRLAPGIRAFGVRATHSSSSRANPAGTTELNLYVHKNGRLQMVLAGLITSSTRGEWDTNCTGEFSQTESTIEVGKTTSHGYADLLVRTTTTGSQQRAENDDCVETTLAPVVTQDTLRYDGNAYVIPPSLRDM